MGIGKAASAGRSELGQQNGTHTLGPIEVVESVGGYTLTAPSVGDGYYGHIGLAVQRDPHPRDGGGIDDATAKANATLWALAPELLAICRDAHKLLDSVAYVADPGDSDELIERLEAALAAVSS